MLLGKSLPQEAKKVASEIADVNVSVELAEELSLDSFMPGEVPMDALWLLA